MARKIVATLRWEGPFDDRSVIAGRAGIYIVIAAQKDAGGNWDPSTYKLLDIGQSTLGSIKLASEEREASWEPHKLQGASLIFKFASMPTIKFDLIDRQIVESCLRKCHRPIPCGTDLDSSYLRRNSVVVKNEGKSSPLHPRCFHGPEDEV